MQQLHLVGFTTESDHLILSAKKGAKSGSFTVPLDERLLEVIAEAIRRRNAEGDADVLIPPPELAPPPPPPPKRVSALTPREIQARLRAGRTITQVANEAAADEDWVANFAPPVLAERERIVERARALVYAKPRRGVSAEPLGYSVRWNLADRGLRYVDDEFDAGWSAFHIADLAWGVTFEFFSRGRRNRAEWEIDLNDHELIARNRLASDLGYVEPGRRRRAAMFLPTASDAKKRAQEAKEQSAQQAPTSAPSAVRKKSRAAKKTVRPAAKKAAKRAPTKTAAKKAAKRAPTKTAAKKLTRTTKKATPKKAVTRTPKKGTTKRAGSKAAKRTTSAAKARGSKRSPRPRVASAATVAEVAGAPAPPRPTPTPQNELARRRLELVGKQLPATRSPRAIALTPPPAPSPPPQPRPRPQPTTAPSSSALDVPKPSPPSDGDAADAAARQRREERRRARSARVAAAAEPAQTPAKLLPEPAPSPVPIDSVIPTDDVAPVTIRAGRAAPASGDVVVPGGRRPLRPALPAAQPKRRRFRRSR